jgi:hypothetical protein
MLDHHSRKITRRSVAEAACAISGQVFAPQGRSIAIRYPGPGRSRSEAFGLSRRINHVLDPGHAGMTRIFANPSLPRYIRTVIGMDAFQFVIQKTVDGIIAKNVIGL